MWGSKTERETPLQSHPYVREVKGDFGRSCSCWVVNVCAASKFTIVLFNPGLRRRRRWWCPGRRLRSSSSPLSSVPVVVYVATATATVSSRRSSFLWPFYMPHFFSGRLTLLSRGPTNRSWSRYLRLDVYYSTLIVTTSSSSSIRCHQDVMLYIFALNESKCKIVSECLSSIFIF